METVTQPRDEWNVWNERIAMHADPPEALVVSIAWDSGDGNVSVVNVWDAPGAIADFFVERIRPVIEEHGEPAHKPERHGPPVAVYLRL